MALKGIVNAMKENHSQENMMKVWNDDTIEDVIIAIEKPWNWSSFKQYIPTVKTVFRCTWLHRIYNWVSQRNNKKIVDMPKNWDVVGWSVSRLTSFRGVKSYMKAFDCAGGWCP